MNGAVIAVDLDGVLHDWLNPAPGGVMGPPIEGAKEAITTLRAQGHHIMIHSCKKEKVIRGWMLYFGIPFDSIWTGVGKPIAGVYLDDRALRFTTWKQTLLDLEDMLGGESSQVEVP